MNVLSLFDGMSCGQLALMRAGIKYNNYFASEIDKFAIAVAQHNFPKTIQLGDVTKIDGYKLSKIDLLIGGSPCTDLSFAGKQRGLGANSLNDYIELKKEGYKFKGQSFLFWEYIRILTEIKPKYFLLENVRMKKEYQDIITSYLGVEPICINSSLVSAQNRIRYYWTNIPNIQEPDDKGILLKDILQQDSDIDEKYVFTEKRKKYIKSRPKNFECKINPEKSNTLRLNYGNRFGNETYVTIPNGFVNYTEVRTEEAKKIRREYRQKYGKDYNPFRAKKLVPRIDDKVNCLQTSLTNNHLIGEINDNVTKSDLRKLTPIECERLQTVQDNYTLVPHPTMKNKMMSNSQRYKMLGNGWTVDVISHIFKNIEKIYLLEKFDTWDDVPKEFGIKCPSCGDVFPKFDFREFRLSKKYIDFECPICQYSSKFEELKLNS